MRSVLAAVAFLALTLPAPAQDEPVRTIPFDGVEVFCHILHHQKLTPLASFDELFADPDSSILIVFGDINGLSEVAPPNRWRHFTDFGGNLLLATDKHFRVPGGPVSVVGDRLTARNIDPHYRGEARCPLLTSAQQTARARKHPLFAGLKKGIATNCPSRLNLVEKKKNPPLVHLYAYESTKGFIHTGGAIAGSPANAWPSGRSLFIAGHGMFMNGMMLQSDNDNFEFAVNAVSWLRERPKGKLRTKALFIVDGEIVTDFDANLTPPPSIPIPPLRAISRLLRGLQDERFFHRLFNELLGGHWSALISVVVAMGTFTLLLYGAKKCLDGRHSSESTVPRLIGVVPELGLVPAVVQQRHALFRQSNLTAEAVLLARAWFNAEFGVLPETWAEHGNLAMSVRGFFGRSSLRANADRVLHLAQGAAGPKLTRRDFAHLLRLLPSLSRARRTGRLALLVEGKTVI